MSDTHEKPVQQKLHEDQLAERQQAEDWFKTLRDRICAAFEEIEEEGKNLPALRNLPGGKEPRPGRFQRTAWKRPDEKNGDGGGGVMAVMKGRIFEKVGVNVSTVHGHFSPEFAKTIPGAEEDPRFFATGISLVAHMANPHVPAAHMNTRFLSTSKSWFAGVADLNPALPVGEDTAFFRSAFRATCDAHGADYWERFSKWCDEYFYMPHRQRHRGVGGIFYDWFETGNRAQFDERFAFTREVGETFLATFPAIIRRRMATPWTEEERDALLRYRSLYAEFNLIYDRGTLFGLKTGGNVDAILMSMPPEVRWS